MAGSTVYPGSLDSYTSNYSDTSPARPVGPDVDNHAAAIDAIESELGTDPSGARSTVKARLDGVSPIGTVTALPGSPSDGDEIAYLADATNGIVWRFKYRSASSSSYKWEFIGGAMLAAEVNTNPAESTASGSYTDLTTVGPTVTIPLAGDYDITVKCLFKLSAGTNPARMSFSIGATAAADADQVLSGAIAAYVQSVRTSLKTGLSASTALVGKYRVDGSNSSDFNFRRIEVVPVRVG